MICRFVGSIFQNADDGCCICRYQTLASQLPPEARRSKGRIANFVAKGTNLPMTSAVDIVLEGRWEKTERFGVQLMVESCRTLMPQTKDGVLTYLKSGALVEMDAKTAQAIYSTFKQGTIDMLENHPERLRAVLGVKAEELRRIQAELEKRKLCRNILAQLEPFGIDLLLAERAAEGLGSDADQQLHAHPFCLYRIPGFDYDLVEEISRRWQADPMDPLRIQSGLLHTMKQAEKKGHLFLPRQELLKQSGPLVNKGYPALAALHENLERELQTLLHTEELQDDLGRVYLPHNRQDEILVAKTVVALLLKKPGAIPNLENEILRTQKDLGLQLSPTQAQAVKTALSNSVSIITGGPGTGKTTTLRVILDVYQRLYPQKKILLAAPTGRASRRMVESTGFETASTLHSALSISKDEAGKRQSLQAPLSADLIVVDEWSMADMYLAMELFTHLQPTTQLVLLGDPDQLPSVGAGNVLREFLRSRLIPFVRLDMIFRQSQGSSIPLNAHYINTVDISHLQLDCSDFSFQKTANTADAVAAIVDAYVYEVHQRGLDKVQILSPVRHRGAACVDALNERVRHLVNPPSPKKAEARVGGRLFRAGDKVMQNENREEASNGDLGFVTDIGRDGKGAPQVTVKFSGGRTVIYSPRETMQLDLAYATTVHKSQGSEFEAVIFPVLTEHNYMLKRNLLYTGVTRAKEQVKLVGQEHALIEAIRKNDTDQRYTLLADRIVAYHRKAQKSSDAALAAKR